MALLNVMNISMQFYHAYKTGLRDVPNVACIAANTLACHVSAANYTVSFLLFLDLPWI